MILSLLITLVTAQLGQIETSGFSSLQPHERANRGQGHYLVIVWENDMRETVDVCPYGDYYDRVESDYGDGDVEVFEISQIHLLCVQVLIGTPLQLWTSSLTYATTMTWMLKTLLIY